ncbi:hypothetical protein [Ureibacillus sinduriensis]|uniref:PglZ domain-containing protein n=1 Tax=Ureibacillus sinduriensis BLB-1 = JCM 15800 TaxID=1384057 RepID=A0A0A3HXX1_9BACL|nr:hypothetical protein [Ureibacillus sinduriensis]KGR75218.1 hypothetical protein CD33_13210 [Ureibacillus sinduriensis BLB-1 = JCM 15800]
MTKTLLDNILLEQSNIKAWSNIKESLYNIFSQPFSGVPVQEIIKREKTVTSIETLISGTSWDLWYSFDDAVPKTAHQITDFWNNNLNGKALLILDGLSLREMPFFLIEAKKRGFIIHQADATASALPSDTTFFAKSLGFSQRSSLDNNQAGNSHSLEGAITEVTDLPWKDCVQLIGSNPNVVLWHTWFDDRIHEYQVPGKGIRELITKSSEQFTSDDFWHLIENLANGRRLVITSDHGYASTGDFINIDGEQAEYLKAKYKNQRFIKNDKVLEASFVPPIDIQIELNNGLYSFVLGRRKWKNSGGYPTLAHGGLSLMETFVPFFEVSKS